MAGTKEGAEKRAAANAGLPVDEYRARLAAGLRRCWACKGWRSDFGADGNRPDGRSPVCRECRGARKRERYVPKPKVVRKGRRFVAARDGDRLQARGRVNHLVRTGLLPDPDTLPCTDCGHELGDGTRHEYDHFQGYAAEHHEHVQAVCSPCHHARENARPRPPRVRSSLGRYA